MERWEVKIPPVTHIPQKSCCCFQNIYSTHVKITGFRDCFFSQLKPKNLCFSFKEYFRTFSFRTFFVWRVLFRLYGLSKLSELNPANFFIYLLWHAQEQNYILPET